MLDKKLYEACKYQVVTNPGDCGMTLAELWHCIHHNTEHGFFWYRMTVSEYQDYLETGDTWLPGKRECRVLDEMVHQDSREHRLKECKRYHEPLPREDLRYKQGGMYR